MSQIKEFDVVVIGAGPGGYVCAIRAAQLGMSVAIVERSELGGICLNWGCIPTKSLLKSAEVLHFMKKSEAYGISAEKIHPNIKAMVLRSRKIAEQLSSGIASLLQKSKVTIIKGSASFINLDTIKVQGQENTEIRSKNFVIATGARAKIIPGFEPDGKNILTYREAMIQESIPKSITIVGSGAIGIEFASFYNSLGTKVLVLESQNTILPHEDKEISSIAHKLLEKEGISIKTSITLKQIESAKDNVSISYEEGGKTHKISSDKAIMAVGITPNTNDLGLENTKVKLDSKGFIVSSANLKADDNIYAIGDVIEGPWLAHKASHEGVIVAENISGLKTKPIDRLKIPSCIYSMPQIASIGLTEARALSSSINVKIGRFPFAASGKALAIGQTDGLIKLIFNAISGELLGAHMIGAEVTELIHSIALAMTLEATEEDIMHTIFPHPTLSEMIHESTLNAFGKALHIPNK